MKSKRENLLQSNIKKDSTIEFSLFNKLIMDELDREEAAYKARVEELEGLREGHIHNKATALAQQVWNMIIRG
jgi:UDP-2,3-diacylglucosamine pyrophosphatase LpxH